MQSESTVTLRIAGIRLRLRGRRGAILRASRRYAPYRCSGRAEVELTWREGDPPRQGPWPEPFVRSHGDGRRVIGRRDFFGEMTCGRGEVVTHANLMALDSFLRVLLSEILPERGGLLLHAAGVAGRLFPGKTDAGKTTLCSFLPRPRVLSDEVVAVWPSRPGFDLLGTPFWGSFVRGTNTQRRRLQAIFFLHRRRREGIEALSSAGATLRLLECTLCFRDDEERADRLLEITSRIAGSVPCFSLSYQADAVTPAQLERRLRASIIEAKGR